MNDKKEIKGDEETPKPIKIISSPETIKGVYSNSALVFHNKNEFVIDFLLTTGQETQLVSRVILSPAHMKDFKNAIHENFEKYEDKFIGKKPKKRTSSKTSGKK